MIISVKHAIRRWRLAWAGIAVETKRTTAWYGRDKLSWIACPDGITPDSVIYSFGIGRDLSLDLTLIARHGVQVHAFDPTPASLEWVRRQVLPPALRVHDIGLAAFDGQLEFHAPRNPGSAHFSPVRRYRQDSGATFAAPVRTLTTIMRDLGHDHIDLLKMDIEGGEYAVIADLVSRNLPVNQLLVEFHHNFATIPFRKTVAAVRALRANGFRVFAIGERTYEVSMIRAV